MTTMKLHIPYEFPVVVCGNCDMGYVVLALPFVASCKEAEASDWMMQDSVSFCPYCGSPEALAAQQVEGNGPACNPYEGMTADEKDAYIAALAGKE
ncbi:MAG: hypothetical protein WC935_00055 [Thermoleophilia bacterium]